MDAASASADCLFVILIFDSWTLIFNASISFAFAWSLVSIIMFEQISAYIFAIPNTETSIPAASKYFPVGPLTGEFPIIGLTATTLVFFFDNSFITKVLSAL